MLGLPETTRAEGQGNVGSQVLGDTSTVMVAAAFPRQSGRVGVLLRRASV